MASISRYLREEIYLSLGNRIKEARKERGMSQAKLAENCSLSRTSITNIEKGRQHLPLHTLFDIAVALGTNVAELLPVLDSREKQDLSDKIPNDLHKTEREWIKAIVSRK